MRYFALFALLTLPSLVWAADGAKFRPIGFSSDYTLFAFEQYGVQDGSGFPYSDIFVLDSSKDAWLPGTPVRSILEDESSSLSQVRKKSYASAEAVLSKAKIVVDPELLAANPFTELMPNRTKIQFNNAYDGSLGGLANAQAFGSWSLSTTSFDLPPPAECEADIGVQGYRLELRNNNSGQTTVLHQDSTLPKSRYCAVGYDLEAVVQPIGSDDGEHLVAIVAVYIRGFEGADRRYIAVPFKLN